jgi:CheY-like chemotaxis protein
MDVRMPGMNGIEATTRLIQAGSRARILMLTTFNLDEYVYHALKAGASGFLLKHACRDQLTGGVRAVAAGETLLAPAITRRLIEDFCRGPAPGTPVASAAGGLSERELGVVRLVAQGLSNAEIAARLYLQRGHHQEPHRPHPRQARPAGPGTGRRLRLRTRHRPARPRHSATGPGNKTLTSRLPAGTPLSECKKSSRVTDMHPAQPRSEASRHEAGSPVTWPPFARRTPLTGH